MIYLRHLTMDGLENCRDLGGYATADGGVTRYGVYLRSELPENLTERDFALLREYHLVRSLDLRGSEETVTQPSDLSRMEGVEYLNIPMFDRAAAAGSESERRRERPQRPPEGFKFPEWDVTYVGMLEQHKHWPKVLLEALAVEDGCVHYNCFTGKDRTGICTAMLFSVVGVSREDIWADYSLSMSYLGRRYGAMAARFKDGPGFGTAIDEEGNPVLSSGFFSTLPTYMRKALEHLDKNYGGMIPYLKECGVTDDVMELIKKRLVEY